MIVVEVVVVDSSRGNEGVDKHRYHGMCVCVSDAGSVSQETTLLCQQRQQRGELRVVTPGCMNEENGSYVTARLRNSTSNYD